MTVGHCQLQTALQGKRSDCKVTEDFVLKHLAMGEFPAHESITPFDTGMRELEDL